MADRAQSSEARRALDAFNSIIAKVKLPAEDISGAQLIVKVLRGQADDHRGAVERAKIAETEVDARGPRPAWGAVGMADRACPSCGDPGFLNENTGERQCGNAACEHTEPLTEAVEMVTIPAADWRGAVEALREIGGLWRDSVTGEEQEPSGRLAVQLANAYLHQPGGR